MTPEEVQLILGFCRKGMAALSGEASLEVLSKGSAAILKFAQMADAEFKKADAVADKTEKNGSPNGQPEPAQPE